MKISLKRYGAYLFRWQLSTPVLAVVLVLFGFLGKWGAAIIANLIGGLMFFWVDRFIFASRMLDAQWQVRENVRCCDCGKVARGYRLVKTGNYDKTQALPEFRCETCSQRKAEELREAGVLV